MTVDPELTSTPRLAFSVLLPALLAFTRRSFLLGFVVNVHFTISSPPLASSKAALCLF